MGPDGSDEPRDELEKALSRAWEEHGEAQGARVLVMIDRDHVEGEERRGTIVALGDFDDPNDVLNGLLSAAQTVAESMGGSMGVMPMPTPPGNGRMN